MNAKSLVGLIIWILLPFGAALVGSQFQPGDWYVSLRKPEWNPPAYVFGPVWSLLYATMGVAAWLVWKRHGLGGAGFALGLFVLQLALNAAWSWVFFGLHRPGLAFAEIIILWLVILATIVAFWDRRPLAGALLLPYIAWVSFAAGLNYAIWRLNA